MQEAIVVEEDEMHLTSGPSASDDGEIFRDSNIDTFVNFAPPLEKESAP